MATNHAGTIVFRLNPNPNWRKLPSVSYMNRGLHTCITTNSAKNTIMEIAVMWRFIRYWFIVNNIIV